MNEPLTYLDSSAYLALLLGEKMSTRIEKAIINQYLCASTFLVLEVERNLVRMAREKVLTEQEYSKLQNRLKTDVDAFVLKDVNLDLCLSGPFPAIKTPRSSDLIHLRTALWFMNNEKLSGFITVDQHQRDAAAELKLPVLEI